MSTSRDIDETLKQNIDPATMSEAESQALWARIEDGVVADERPASPGARGNEARFRSRRLGLLGGAAAVAAIAVAAVLLAPSSERRNGALDLAKLDAASAAEVFDLTADAAREQPSLMPGPGQVLYFRLAHTARGERPERTEVEEWIDPDGRGVRLDGSAGGSSSSDGSFEPLRLEFDADALDRNLAVTDSWRSTFTLAELEAIPTESRQALRYVRRFVESSTGLAQRPRLDEHSILGGDFLVLASISSMLMEAPLTGEQRAALLEVVADAPRWYRSDGSAAITVANHGRSTSRDGREGILIEASVRLSRIEAAIVGSGRREISYGVLLDPDQGSVLETRVGLGRNRPPTIWVTSQALELRDAADVKD